MNLTLPSALAGLVEFLIDSLKFTTPKGKVVYGGGGIIPDVFVAVDTTSYIENEYFEHIENYISTAYDSFSNALDRTHNIYSLVSNHTKVSNLSKWERRTMFALKNHPTCSLKVADKNLGGIWLEKSMYITRAYVDHLSDTLTYSEVETVPVQQIYKQIRRAVSRYKDSVDDVSRKYILNKVTPETCTVPTFYLLIKILKYMITLIFNYIMTNLFLNVVIFIFRHKQK